MASLIAVEIRRKDWILDIILQVEPMAFTNGLEMEKGEQDKSGMIPKFLIQLLER